MSGDAARTSACATRACSASCEAGGRPKLDGSWLDQHAVLESQAAPLGARPQAFADLPLGFEHGVQARFAVRRQFARIAVSRRCGRLPARRRGRMPSCRRCRAMIESSVASRHSSRGAPATRGAGSRSSPRNGSSRITSRTPGRSSARPNRTRCPSPPETRPPPSPSGVAGPSGSRSSTRRNSAASMASSSGIRGSAGKPYSRFSLSGRFQSWTAGSTQAVCGRSRSSRLRRVRRRRRERGPMAGRCHPKKQADQAGLSRARWAHYRDVLPASNGQTDVCEHGVPGHRDGDVFEAR